MKKMALLAGVLVLMLVFGGTIISCVTTSSIGGTSDTHGFFSLRTAARNGEAIASYGVILGLFTTGYDTYASAVKMALDNGKIVSSETVHYLGVYIKVTAYAR